VLISDLLAKTEMLAQRLSYLRSQGHEVVLLRVLDPAELEFEFDKAAMFVDMESGRDLYIDPKTAREQYRRNFSHHARDRADVPGAGHRQLPAGDVAAAGAGAV
jgi:hypothetical protein